jgi:hypothetical protein
MVIIPSTVKAYIAGFLDADGCITFQLVRRKDYRYGFQVRACIVFYQKALYQKHLEWLKSLFSVGYVRVRSDGMSEYTIVGLGSVMQVLELLKPYVRVKNHRLIWLSKLFNASLKDRREQNGWMLQR